MADNPFLVEDVEEGYIELLTTLFQPLGDGKHVAIEFYCRCGGELHGLRHPDGYIELDCLDCGWCPKSQQEAAYELASAFDEFERS